MQLRLIREWILHSYFFPESDKHLCLALIAMGLVRFFLDCTHHTSSGDFHSLWECFKMIVGKYSVTQWFSVSLLEIIHKTSVDRRQRLQFVFKTFRAYLLPSVTSYIYNLHLTLSHMTPDWNHYKRWQHQFWTILSHQAISTLFSRCCVQAAEII